MKTFKVTIEAGETLQNFLAQRLGLSRNRSKALIDAKGVLVNRRRVWMARHTLRAGDTVELAAEQPRTTAVATPQALLETRDFLIVDKPAGVTANGPESAEAMLREARSEPALRAAHRLDRDTSGCLLVARSDAAFDRAVEIFRGREVHKRYDAIAAGRVEAGRRDISIPLDGVSAITRIRVVSSNEEATHLAVVIETGRTHQIRRHLAMIGHPVLGDKEHWTRHAVTDRQLGVPRQMLHATELSFRDTLAGQLVRAESPLPDDFRTCLSRFRLR